MKDLTKTDEYEIKHAKHGCYEVILISELKEARKFQYLTNFRNKKAAKAFIEAHKKGEVTIDYETNIPTPDFK